MNKLFINRQYKTGTNWCFWRWTFVPSNYITRLHLIKTPLFSICLHWLNKPDEEPYLHDHPVSFVSVILKGWYKEQRMKFYNEPYPAGIYTRSFVKTNRWFNFVEASKNDRHRIIEVAPGTLTLCFMGPKTREWGFYITEPGINRWVYWKDYYKMKEMINSLSKSFKESGKPRIKLLDDN